MNDGQTHRKGLADMDYVTDAWFIIRVKFHLPGVKFCSENSLFICKFNSTSNICVSQEDFAVYKTVYPPGLILVSNTSSL